jgi:predicted NUDIX family phosphoesterase
MTLLDRNEDAWTGPMVTDQVTRPDTRTGEMLDYLLLRSTNIRRVFVDNRTTPGSAARLHQNRAAGLTFNPGDP